MTDSDILNFRLLRLALGGHTAWKGSLAPAEWADFYRFCRQQALLGIGFVAVERLHGQGILCPDELKRRWMLLALQVEEANRRLNARCAELTRMLAADGLRSCVLKGQGNAFHYPESLRLRRQSGDIDVWCVPPHEGLELKDPRDPSGHALRRCYGHRAVIAYVMQRYREAGEPGERPRPVYHHIDAPFFADTEVEVHYRPSFCHSFWRNRRLQRWFRAHEEACMSNMTALGFAMPPDGVNVVYQMSHLFAHLFETGIGLRQFVDYCFLLRRLHESGGAGFPADGKGTAWKEEAMRALRSFGMARFAAAVMWVMRTAFGLPAEACLCPPDAREGERLLSDILQGGNFGQHDECGRKWRNGRRSVHAAWKLLHVFRLVRNYPEEALSEPFFRLWHWGWRRLN